MAAATRTAAVPAPRRARPTRHPRRPVSADVRPALPARARDPLTLYYQQLRRLPLLSASHKEALARRAVEQGDLEAARELVQAHLRLVVKIAFEHRRAHQQILDLIQEGNVGLLHAVRKFDPDRGVKFSTYAAWWIRAYILKHVVADARLVKLGTTQEQRKLFFHLSKERQRLEGLGIVPESRRLAERLDVSERAVDEMTVRLGAPELSLDAPVSTRGAGDRTRQETLPAPSATRPDVEAQQGELRSLVGRTITTFAATLRGREQRIFQKRWLADPPSTLQEVGVELGVSRERVRQLERRILDRLRARLQAQFPEPIDFATLHPDD